MKRLCALFAILALVAVGCGGDDDDAVATGAAAQPTAVPESEDDGEMAEDDGEMAEDDGEMAEDDGEMAEDDGEMADDDVSFPVTVVHGLGELTLDSRPVSIVSLSPTATEMLFAVGAGPQVIAVDDQSNYPPEAPMTDLSAFTLNIEAVIGFEPDLVVHPGIDEASEAALAAAGIPSMSMFAAVSFDDVYSQIEALGAATGNIGAAAELVGMMQTDIAAISAEVTQQDVPLTYYHELTPDPFSVTSTTFIGQVYAVAGLENIADAADSEGFGYPQLSAEYILEEDPDLIFLADTKCCGENAETLASRPGWGELTAVQNGNVVELDDDVASRWGPRIVDFLRVIVDATADLELAVAG